MLAKMISFIYIGLMTMICFYVACIISKKFELFEKNYRGKDLWIGTGAVIPILLLLLYPVQEVLYLDAKWWHITLLSTILGIIGFYDDRYGIKTVKGIKGHLHYFFSQKKLSSGLIKVLGTFIVGLIMSYILFDEVFTIILSTLVFSIWTNIINLLDVRPGRAIKGVFLILLCLMILYGNWLKTLDFVLLLWMFILFIVDVREIGMLGDTGANILGGITGYWIINNSTILGLFVYLIFGLFLTIYAEKSSFSSWIEKHPLIKKIDHWGRFT